MIVLQVTRKINVHGPRVYHPQQAPKLPGVVDVYGALDLSTLLRVADPRSGGKLTPLKLRLSIVPFFKIVRELEAVAFSDVAPATREEEREPICRMMRVANFPGAGLGAFLN